jgi:hypothetical protein
MSLVHNVNNSKGKVLLENTFFSQMNKTLPAYYGTLWFPFVPARK